MNNYSGVTAKILGIYAAILAAVHGIFEYRQGNLITNGININAMGPNCAAGQLWHACFPAITLWSTYRLAGIFTILVSAAFLILVIFFLQTTYAKWLIFILTITVFLCGGGFIAALAGLMAGGNLLISPKKCTSSETQAWVRYLWMFIIVVYLLYAAGGWILGMYFNTFMANFSGLLFILMNILFPLLAIILAKFSDH